MKEVLITKISEALEKLTNEKIEIEVTKPKESENGDYSTNIALKLAKVLQRNPLDIAESFQKEISDENILKIEVKKPGFINFFLKKDYLFSNINKVLEEKDNYGRCEIGQNKKINIEFVSANPTGILHMGNARGGAYGDSLARILSFAGYDVTKEYYVNDAGNQIHNLGLSILARYKSLCGIESEIPENGYHGPEIKRIAEDIYAKYQDSYLDKDLSYFKELGTKILLEKIVSDLKEYRIEYDCFTSEKELYQKYSLKEIVENMTKAGYTYENEGAIWFKSSNFYDSKDHVLIKADGSYTYLVPDIANHINKYNRGYDRIIDVLGTDHHGYLARLKGAMKANGYDDSKIDIKLLQLVRLIKDGEEVRMSKRTGNTITLKDLILEVGVNAARYYFSKNSLDTQMDFDLNLAKSKSNENPVFYVCYAYARICSILKEKNNNKIIEKYVAIDNDSSYNVLEKVYEFPEVVKKAASKELPHLITNYCYELATAFHLYYSKNRILTDDEEETLEKINLIKSVKQTLWNALNLIGVVPPEQM